MYHCGHAFKQKLFVKATVGIAVILANFLHILWLVTPSLRYISRVSCSLRIHEDNQPLSWLNKVGYKKHFFLFYCMGRVGRDMGNW